jgi:predicted nucleotidyltransferase
MSATYNSFKQYIFGEHQEAFQVLIKVFEAVPIHYFLIGAQARDVHFYRQGIKPSRGTRDIDFAVMVDTMEDYNHLKNELLTKGFEATLDPYRLNWKLGETVIDLLPFGQIEQDYTVNFDERDIELSVLGYRELNEELEEYYIDEDQSVAIPIPPLHGIFILKLLSWGDKQPDREKDLIDLYQIIDNYWSFVADEAYEKHLDLFTDDFETVVAAARILGRHLKGTLSKSKVLQDRVLSILVQQSNSIDNPGLMMLKFAEQGDISLERVKQLMDEVIKGVKEGMEAIPVATVDNEEVSSPYPPYNFYLNANGSKLKTRTIYVDDKYDALRLFNITLNPIEAQNNLVLEVEFFRNRKKEVHSYPLADLFYNPKSPDKLFFRKGGNDFIDVELPPGNKEIVIRVVPKSDVKSFDLMLGCQYV